MSERRQYGSGSVEAHGSGWRWVARIAGRRIKSRPYPTKEEAIAVLGEALRMSVAGDVAPVAALTLRQWGVIWLRRREAAGKRSWKEDRSRWRRHVLTARFIDLPLASIRRRDLKAWVAELQLKSAAERHPGGAIRQTGSPLSAPTIRHCVILVHGALAAAVDDELLELNPAEKLKVESPPQTDEPWTYLTEAEIGQLFAWLREQPDPEMMLALYTVAIYAGLRKGELIPLHWVDVDLGERPQITVRYSRQGGTKSGRIRRVPLLAQPAAALRAWAAAAMASSAPGLAPVFVFPTPSGARWSDDYGFRWADKSKGHGHHMRGIKSRCGIARDVRFHDLRHTCASHLLMGTWGRAWRFEEVRDLLGHKRIDTTQRYAHLSPDHLHAAAAATVRAPALGTSSIENVPRRGDAGSPQPREIADSAESGGAGHHRQSEAAPRADFDLPGGHLGDIQRAAAVRLLRLAAAAEPVPTELLMVLGIPEGAHSLRQAITLSRQLLGAGSGAEVTAAARAQSSD